MVLPDEVISWRRYKYTNLPVYSVPTFCDGAGACLVYGTNKVANDTAMVHEANSPQAVAEAVYRALVSGVKLPPLNDSEELRAALLSFQPSSTEGQEADMTNRNRGESWGGEDSNKPVSSKDCPGPGSSREEGCRSRSALMVEALSRRRMDAVRQLHEICPQLLASLPLFDHTPAADCPEGCASGIARCPMTCSDPGPDPNTASASSDTLTPNSCHFHRSSHLLDLAAENQTLLVFVLQHHPEVSRQSPQAVRDKASPAKCRAQISKKCDAYDSIGSAHDNCQYQVDALRAQTTPPPTDSSCQRRSEQARNEGSGGSSSENKEDDQKVDEGEEDPLSDLDSNSPVTICIRKNNAEVLQYLLFKHVWQHFLLDEVFNLPHNSYVPDLVLEDFLHTCPQCPWFLHCAALMGCPQLLQLVLSGHFCQHGPQPASPPPSPRGNPHTSGTPSPAKDDTSKCISTGVQSLSENPDVHEIYSDHTLPPDSSKTVPVQKRLESTGAKHADPGTGDEHSSDKQSVLQSPLPSTSSDLPKNSPSCSCASDMSSQGTTSKSSEYEMASVSHNCMGEVCDVAEAPTVNVCNVVQVPTVARSPSQSFTDAIPDPNKMFPVSLPIIDRWISRCMHVKLTPLHLACWRCDPDSIKVLLSHGADVTILAEELTTPDAQKDGETLDTASSQATGPASADSSSVELTLNLVAVTANSSSFDLTTRHSSLEEDLKRRTPDQPRGLSALALLALGIRSPPDFSLSIGKSLGLVMPTLPELWGGQVDRSCWRTRQSLLEAMQLLLEAGCDVNVTSVVFGKSYRVMELFLQPSVDMYYAPLMPRGGRDSAVLRCMDLERVADVVLSACWDLCSRGGQLGPGFAASMEWNLFRMDWMFLPNEPLQTRFMHLAVFLGLFPPLDPALYMGRYASAGLSGNSSASRPSSEASQSSVGFSPSGLDLREGHLQPYSPPPPRPSCIPWAPSTSGMSSSQSDEGLPANRGQVDQPSEEAVTSESSSETTRAEVPPQGSSGAEAEPDITPPPAHFSDHSGRLQTRNVSSSNPSLPASRVKRKAAEQASGPSSAQKAQMILWGLEERRRRCLEKFANETVRLSMSPACLALVLRFLGLPDLNLLARITQHQLETSTSSTESPLQRLHDAVCQAQLRTLQHSCKQAILVAVSWRPHAVHCLPLPDCLKRYLLDPC